MATMRAAVLGQDGVDRYSLSPMIHSYFFKKTGILGEYTAIPVSLVELHDKIGQLRGSGYIGVNLTIPHKVDAMQFFKHSPEVATIGAMNTVSFKDDIGYNTDYYGFIQPLKRLPKKTIVVGAGGAARAVIYGLQTIGATNIAICNRTDEKSVLLAKEFGIESIAWNDRQQQLPACDLLVNTTPAGMNGNEPLEISLQSLPKNAVVYDIVYNPLLTPLLRQAADMGLQTIDGLGMLLHQAAKAFEIWFGELPKVDDDLRTHILSIKN